MKIATELLVVARSGGKLSTSLYTAATSSARTDKDLTDIAGDVALTSTALRDVGNFLKERRGFTVASQSAIEDANSIVKRCHDAFKEIHELATKSLSSYDGNGKSNTHGRLLWPLRGMRLELLKKRLESLKSSLVLLLSVLNFRKEQKNECRSKQEVQQQGQEIQQLYHRHRDALAEVSQLERRLEAAILDDTPKPPSPKRIKTEHRPVPVSSPNINVTGLTTTFAFVPNLPTNSTQERKPGTPSEIELLIARTRGFLSSVELVAKSMGNFSSNSMLLAAEAKVKQHSQMFMGVLHSYLNTTGRMQPERLVAGMMGEIPHLGMGQQQNSSGMARAMLMQQTAGNPQIAQSLKSTYTPQNQAIRQAMGQIQSPLIQPVVSGQSPNILGRQQLEETRVQSPRAQLLGQTYRRTRSPSPQWSIPSTINPQQLAAVQAPTLQMMRTPQVGAQQTAQTGTQQGSERPIPLTVNPRPLAAVQAPTLQMMQTPEFIQYRRLGTPPTNTSRNSESSDRARVSDNHMMRGANSVNPFENGPTSVTRKPPVDPSSFGDLSEPAGFNLDFSTDGPDILENFDFDSFLHNTHDRSFPPFLSGPLTPQMSQGPAGEGRGVPENNISMPNPTAGPPQAPTTEGKIEMPGNMLQHGVSQGMNSSTGTYRSDVQKIGRQLGPPAVPGTSQLSPFPFGSSSPQDTPAFIGQPFDLQLPQKRKRRHEAEESEAGDNQRLSPDIAYAVKREYPPPMLPDVSSLAAQTGRDRGSEDSIAPQMGNAALQDYEQQMMSLEAQNNKARLKARQEHDDTITSRAAMNPMMRMSSNPEHQNQVMGKDATMAPMAPMAAQSEGLDYQMQLMLLEQKNKKRLLMARQQPDNMVAQRLVPQGPSHQGRFEADSTPGEAGGERLPSAALQAEGNIGAPFIPGAPLEAKSGAGGLFQDNFAVDDGRDVVEQLLARWTVDVDA